MFLKLLNIDIYKKKKFCRACWTKEPVEINMQ